MYAISYKETSANCFKFTYKVDDLKRWLARGRNYGDSGPLLIEWNNGVATYKSFGAIENPSKNLYTINMEWCDSFDGVFNPEHLLEPKEFKMPSNESYRYDILLFK